MDKEKISFINFKVNLRSLFSKLNQKSYSNYSDKNLTELDAIFGHLPTAANIFDHKLISYIYCNENLSSLMGYPRELFIGENGMQTVYNTFHPQHIAIYSAIWYPKVFQVMNDAVSNGEDVREFKFSSTFKAIRSDKHEFWCQVQFGVVETTSDGAPMLTLSLLNDISHIKKDSNLDFLVYRTSKGQLQQTLSYTSFCEDKIQLKLSKREIEVLNLVKNGNTSKEIAQKLFLSESTVSTHRKNMLNKTNSKNMAELIQFALAKNIL